MQVAIYTYNLTTTSFLIVEFYSLLDTLGVIATPYHIIMSGVFLAPIIEVLRNIKGVYMH